MMSRAGAYSIRSPSARPAITERGASTAGSPLTWEVLDAIGSRARWPEPDRFSTLLDTLAATRGVPVGERIRELASSGDQLTVQSLSGEEVQTSRPQFRALLSIYS